MAYQWLCGAYLWVNGGMECVASVIFLTKKSLMIHKNEFPGKKIVMLMLRTE